ncbi:hypothetical protein NE237_019241 [Protea cynaroides]|uniref:BZIP domain-containing protein n=2 Tax=Magnoliopsida TaxID=3398 RepID=A0A9Q0QPR4_9MAGN|nr:hypothetical protein NE237_019241 [Protea cynaroides]
MGKGPFSFCRKIRRRRPKKMTEIQMHPLDVHINNNNSSIAVVAAKGKKKTGGSRLWMRFDRFGQTELLECDKNAIIKRASIPARDLRILGPVFSQSSNILAREKAMVVNLEFIKAIVTAEEVLLLDPLCQYVIPFVDQLKQQLLHKSPIRVQEAGLEESHPTPGRQWLPVSEAAESLQHELPFEFQVLEVALEFVCTYLDNSVAGLEKEAYPVLDELARNVSTKNLERVRSLKSNLTRLLAQVQKVRDEIEHLLDDNEDMAQLYLTRKWIQNQQYESLMATAASNSIVAHTSSLRRLGSNRSASLATTNHSDDHDVEDLEMLLEAYFMQLDGTRNKILSVREYIDDTEDYVNIQLDNQRNELIQLQLTLTIASFAIAVETMIAGTFGMNMKCQLFDIQGIFGPFVGGISAVCFLLFLLMLGYARWKKLLGICSIYAMANSKGSSNVRNLPYSGKQSLLPPKSPFPSIPASYAEYGTNPAIGSKGILKQREGHRHHQRTSSESFLTEEQPSWLDDLLNEPETPVRRGHRRSSSDSFAYVDMMANASNMENVAQEDKFKNASLPIWGSLELDLYKDAWHASFYTDPTSFGRQQDRSWDSSLNSVSYLSGHPSSRDTIVRQSSGQLSVSQELDGVPPTATDKQEHGESGSHNLKGSSDKRDNSYAKSSASETDPKRAKQQFAQRSRVRKLQYIAELERNVQALQAKGSEFSAELEFLDQQSLILSMENKALKQRLESLAQEQLIKYLEHEVLEREIARLRALYQQQQQPPQPPTHRRGSSRDLDSQFANLSLKHKEASSGHDPVTGPLHI